MKPFRHTLLLCGYVVGLLVFSPHTARAQEISPTSYLFVEVKEATGKAAVGATLTLSRPDGTQAVTAVTGDDGAVRTQFHHRSEHHYNVRVSKAGEPPYEDVLFSLPPHGKLNQIVAGIPSAAVEFGRFGQTAPVKIVLPAATSTRAEREAYAAGERGRRLLLAAKRGDAAGLRALLEAGVKADTTDAAGVPAVAWAALAGGDAAVEQLLDAGADVRKNRLGRQALLLYLSQGLARGSYGSGAPNGSAAAQGKALHERHSEVVRRLLAAGAGVNESDPHQGTVLTAAISQIPYGLTPETFKELLAAGANVNAAGEWGQTPLMLAAQQTPSEDMLKTLLEAGAKASINAKDKRGRTALMYALSWGEEAPALTKARALLAAGASVNDADAEGRTALMLAARRNSAETIRTLLDAGARASVNAKDKDGQTALMLAVIGYGGGESDFPAGAVRALLAAGAGVNEADAKGRTALMYAAQMYHDSRLEVTKALLAAGAKVNAYDAEGQTALMLAAKTNSVKTVKALLEAGAKAWLDAKDKKGNAALSYAVAENYGWKSETAAALLAAGADVNVTGEGGLTPLQMAAQRNGEGTIKLLLEAGARVNARDEAGKTALAHAVSRRAGPEVIKALVAAGADVNAADGRGETPLMAAASDNEEVLPLLLESGAKSSVNAKDKDGTTALMRAAFKGPDVARALIAAGADVNVADASGRTTLMQAALFNRSVETLKALLEAGADVNAKDKEGRTALMHSINKWEPTSAEKVKLLLAAGADIHARDAQGQTALMLARTAGDTTVAQLLAEAEARR